MNIQFEQQKITIQTKEEPVEIEATVGIGTGLAYHLKDDGYITITAVNTGHKIVDTDMICPVTNIYYADDDEATKHFIARLAEITDWNQDTETIVSDLKAKYKDGRGLRKELFLPFWGACCDVEKATGPEPAQEPIATP